MFRIRRIDISIFHCVICSQLLLLCFPEVVSMNAFFNDQINIFCCKRLKCYFFAKIIFTFYAYLLPVTSKRFIIVIKYLSFSRMTPKFAFSIRMPQILMLKLRPRNFYIKVILMFIRIYRNYFSFEDIQSYSFCKKLLKL